MNDNGNMSVGVVGLGIIGSVWAEHLNNAGLLKATWNRTPKPAMPLGVDSPREVAEQAKTVIVVVADPPAVEQVLRDIGPALTAGHLVIQSSTIGPADSERFEAMVTSTGARYLEAPFTGSKPAAEAKKLVYYLGGDADVIKEAEPVLQVLSARRIPIGTGRQASTIKLAMNLQIAVISEALCEALHTARGAGIADDTFFDCMRLNVAWSGLAALKEPKLKASDYATQFSVKHLLKDLRCLREAIGELPGLSCMIQQFEKAYDAGEGDADFISLYNQLPR